jgi:hypothetical protein
MIVTHVVRDSSGTGTLQKAKAFCNLLSVALTAVGIRDATQGPCGYVEAHILNATEQSGHEAIARRSRTCGQSAKGVLGT